MSKPSSPRFLLFLAAVLLLAVALVVGAGDAEGKTITVDDNGEGDYTTIQKAIDNATEGDTIRVWAGTYYEDVVVNKTLDLVGNGTTVLGYSRIDGSGDVIKITADWCNVSGFKILKGTKGIYVSGAENITLSDLWCNLDRSPSFGIRVSYCSNITVSKVESFRNDWLGLYIDNSHNCTIADSRISYNTGRGGISLYSSQNILFDNITSRSNYGYGLCLESADHNVINGCTIAQNLERGVVLSESHYTTIANSTCYDHYREGVSLSESTFNTIINITVFENGYGIRLKGYSHFNTIRKVNGYSNKYGVYVYQSNNNTVAESAFNDHERDGISFVYSHHAVAYGNRMVDGGIDIVGDPQYFKTLTIPSNNTVMDKPVYFMKNQKGTTVPLGAGQVILLNCSHVTIRDQDVNSGSLGVRVVRSSNITISRVRANHNTGSGILLEASEYCTVEDVVCSNNQYYGIEASSIEHSMICNSSFTNNEKGIYIDQCSSTCLRNVTCEYNTHSGIDLRYGAKTITIMESFCQNNQDYGIHFRNGSSSTITDSFISNNRVGIYMVYYSTDNAAHNNTITDNQDYGIEAGREVDATNNWWGHNSGPYHETENPYGKGDNVTDHVEFDPWIGKEKNEPPTATIHSVSPDPAYHYEDVRFEGNGTDDGEIIRYAWRSSIDKELYNGTDAGFTISNLSRGTHIIYLRVQDDWGIWSEEVSRTLRIKPEARKQPSNIGLYMREEGDDRRFSKEVKAGEDDTVTFELKLMNYNDSDPVDRVVLLYVIPDVQGGDEDNWEFEFTDAIDPWLPFFTGEHPDHGTMDFYKYVVKGDGTPTNVTFEVGHDYEVMADNEDDMEFLIHGLDYELEDEPEAGDELERFLFKLIENGSKQNHNGTYLMDDGEEPDVDAANARNLRAFVYHPIWGVVVYPKDPSGVRVYSIDMRADQEYNELLVDVTNVWKDDDECNLMVELDDPCAPFWNIRAQAPYTLGDYVPLDRSGGTFTVTLLISLKEPMDWSNVPEGSYALKLRAKSKMSDDTDEETVTINLLQRWGLEFNLDPTDTYDKNANTDGTPTTFTFKLTNSGTFNDTFTLEAEVQDIWSRAGDTHDHWTLEFYPSSPVTLEPGETTLVLVNLTPELDNGKIPPGKYPVYVNVSSTGNDNRTDEAVIHVRMPLLYQAPWPSIVPPAGDSLQIGTEGAYTLFDVKNKGQADDTFTLGFTIRDSDDVFVASADAPGDWVYSFEDADTGVAIGNDQLALPPATSRNIRFKITPPVTAVAGEYDIVFSIIPRDPTTETKTTPASSFTLTPPDLWIDSGDIEIVPPEVDEGDEVTIRATVHLDGAIDTQVTVEFYYHTAASGFTYIGDVELDLDGKANTAETVEFTWKAKVPYAIDQNIKVLVDAENVVDEESENNNQATATITVREIIDPPPPPRNYSVLVGIMVVVLVILALIFRRVRNPPLRSPQRKPSSREYVSHRKKKG